MPYSSYRDIKIEEDNSKFETKANVKKKADAGTLSFTASLI